MFNDKLTFYCIVGEVLALLHRAVLHQQEHLNNAEAL